VTDRVVVAIPTFRRPKNLHRLLDALAQLSTDALVHLVVADNDAQGKEGFKLCAELAPKYRWPLKCVIASERGIAQVRNTLMQEALADGAEFIAMIDDDEWPAPDWIDQYLAAQRQSNADCLQGAILFDPDNGGSNTRPDIAGGSGMPESAGNLFLKRQILAAMSPPWFDPAFALTGGEDKDFFLRLKSEGAKFAWADLARVFGDVPLARTSLSWSLARAYSNGNSDMRVLLKYHPGAVTLFNEAAKILGVLLLSVPLAVILSINPNRRMMPLIKLFRAAGKLSAIAGRRYNEYAAIHGE
jgi:glycosyltransferase involved in cell wall biosynthesis